MAQSIADCVPIEDDQERLRCYDAASGRSALEAARARSTRPISLWERRILTDAARPTFTLTTREPIYVLYTRVSTPNNGPYRPFDPDIRLRDDEIKFRLSAQTKLADDLFGRNGDLWVSYTQTAYWQVFSERISSPFRETDHEPSLFLSFLTDARVGGISARSFSFGVTHTSNGQRGSLSRSWNRLFAEMEVVAGNWMVRFEPWIRLKESPRDDDNPDIEDYMGRYELAVAYERSGHLFQLTLRNVFDDEHRYAASFDWSFPISGRLRGLLQWYNGYGESLIDYNYKQHRIGIGFLISDWL